MDEMSTNTTGATSTSDYLHDHPEFNLTITIGLSIVTIIGIFTNFFAAVILVWQHRPLSVQNQLVLTTLICDVIISSYVIPKIIYLAYQGEEIAEDDLYCRLDGYLRYILVSQYLMGLVLISAHRYTIILKPKWKMKGKRPVAAVLGCLLSLSTYLLPAAVGFWGKFAYRKSQASCTLALREDPNSRSFNYTTYFLGFFLPLVCMTVFYGLIIRAIRQQNKIMNSKLSEPTDPRKQKRKKTEMYITRMCMLLVLVYIVTNLPRSVGFVVRRLDENPLYHSISLVMYYLHVVYGPIFFVFGDRNVQRKLKMWCFGNKGALSQQTNTLDITDMTV